MRRNKIYLCDPTRREPSRDWCWESPPSPITCRCKCSRRRRCCLMHWKNDGRKKAKSNQVALCCNTSRSVNFPPPCTRRWFFKCYLREVWFFAAHLISFIAIISSNGMRACSSRESFTFASSTRLVSIERKLIKIKSSICNRSAGGEREMGITERFLCEEC